MHFREQNRKKAVTFSYDDGVVQDIHLIELLNRYGLKATFNLNSAMLGQGGILQREGQRIAHYKIRPEDVKYVYEQHEVAAHTLTHPNLTRLDEEEVVREAEEDRLRLSELVGYEVVGLAYPAAGSGPNFDERVAEILRRRTGIRYGRTTVNTDSFAPQTDLFRFRPNVYHIMEPDRLMAMGRRFLEEPADTPQILYIWGHAYEMDYAPDRWVKLEEFFRLIAGRDDIFYGTNAEVLL